MLVPISWLAEFVKIPVKTRELAEKLLLSGTKVEEITKVGPETVLNLEITPNRPDTLSIYGVAREVAAIFGEDLKDPDTTIIENPKVTGKPRFKVENKKLCPFYSLVKLDNVFIKDSPAWMKDLLMAAGIRPINNVVDITNFVMLELGQPMHAFDLSKIAGTMNLRGAKKGEKVTTLDGVTREVPEGAIVIEDEEKIVDLAGLMGGKNSEVDKATKEILLHVPVYEPVTIRKTSLFTNLRSEASNRFEKKLDPNLHPNSLRRAVKLLVTYANARLASEIVSVGYPVLEKSLEFDYSLVKEVLGIDLTIEEIINLLTPLGFRLKESPLVENSLLIQIPSHRQDVSIPEDILEEIGRIYGYNNFPKTLPNGALPIQPENFLPNNDSFLREQALRAGFTELTSYTLVAEKEIVNFGLQPEKALKVLHRTSADFEYLRPSLLLGLLSAIAVNQKERGELSFFEIGKEFSSGIDPSTKLPQQDTALGLTTTKSFRELKGVVEELLAKFNLKLAQKPFSDNLSSGVVFLEGSRVVAKVTNIDQSLLRKYEINRLVTAAWLDYGYLEHLPLSSNYQPQAKFPPLIEEVSFFKERGEIGDILSAVEKLDSLIARVEFLEAPVVGGKQSVSLRIFYQDPHKTLNEKDIEKTRRKVSKLLTTVFKATLR